MASPDYRTPGQLIKDLLDERGWTHQVLAAVIEMDRSVLSKVIKGSRPVDAELAMILSEVFDIQPERFMELQTSFDLAQARIVTRPNPMRATRAHLFSSVPVPELMKRGWIKQSDLKDSKKVEDSLTAFFEADSLGDIEILPHAAKKTNVTECMNPVQLAWLYRVRSLAREMLCAKFTKAKCQAAIKKLEELRYAPEEIRHVPKILGQAGIRLVIVESLKGSKIDGVCFWLDDNSPVIGLSLRFDRIDNFWFVLRHELEHVVRGDGKLVIKVDSNLEGENGGTTGDISEEEKAANVAGADFCVSQKILNQFIKRKAPIFSERDVRGFAKMQHVHPGLIAGQIQRRTGRYELFRKFLVPIRKHLTPGAMVDGWGDIPPVD